MSYKGMVGAMGWSSDDSEIVIKATELFNLVSKETGFMFSEGEHMPEELTLLQNIIQTLRTETNPKTFTVEEIEEFYDQTGEDWHLWDEEEKGPYPIDRVFNAMKIFIERKKSSSVKEYPRDELTEEYLKDELKKYKNVDVILMNKPGK